MNILIVDDHPLIREGLGNVLAELDRGVRIHEADDAAPALAAAESCDDLALILLDLALPGAEGMSLLAEMRAKRPDVPVVVLSANDDRTVVQDAIELGAMAFISKRSPTKVLVNALRLVLAGGVYVPPQALGTSAAQARQADGAGSAAEALGLTPRQLEVLALLIQGKPNKIICRDLDMSEGTAKTHITAILRALNVSNRTQAVFTLARLNVRLPQLQAASGKPA